MARNKINISEKLLKNINELQQEINYSDFQYGKYFIHLCDLQPNNKDEKLDIIELNKDYENKKGFVYILVIENKIFKIGQSITTIKKRIQSYNCGREKYRKSKSEEGTGGTNSVTNYYILQSLLNINKTVNVYAYFPPDAEYILFDTIKYKGNSSPSKVAEGIIIEKFIENFNKKPIGNVQK